MLNTCGSHLQRTSQTLPNSSNLPVRKHVTKYVVFQSFPALPFTAGSLAHLQQQTVWRRDGHQRRVRALSAAALDNVLTIASNAPLRDVLAALFAAIGSKLLVRFFYMLEAWETIDQNTSRKLVHTLAGPLFIVTWPLFSSASYAQYIAAVVPALNIARLLLVGYGWREDRRAVAAMSRTGDAKELLRGPLYYTLVLFAVVCIYWRTSPVGAAPHVIPVSFLICSACVGAAWFSPAVPRSLSDPFCSTSELLL